MRRITIPPGVDRFDERFDRLWEHIRGNPKVDRVFYTASEAGDFAMIWMALAGIQGRCSCVKVQGRGLMSTRSTEFGWYMTTCYSAVAKSEVLAKLPAVYSRPWWF